MRNFIARREKSLKVLVTGGSGFIGTRLIDELLKEGHEVKIFDKRDSQKYPNLVTIGDVRDEQALTKACEGMDVIYNLAAEHADNVTPISLYEEVNVGGAENVIKAAQKNNIKKIIFTSSVAIYGLNRGEPDETFDAQPFNEYGRTKYEAEKIFIKWQEEDPQNSLVIIRPCVIFGENNRGNVYNLMKQIYSGKFIMVGNGENKKSMGYVGNIAKLLLEMINAKEGLTLYNFADKPDLKSIEIVNIIRDEMGMDEVKFKVPYFIGLLGGYTFDLISKITGKKFPVSSIRIKKFAADTTISTKRLIESGFKAPYSLEEGLRRMVRSEFLEGNKI